MVCSSLAKRGVMHPVGSHRNQDGCSQPNFRAFQKGTAKTLQKASRLFDQGKIFFSEKKLSEALEQFQSCLVIQERFIPNSPKGCCHLQRSE